MGNYPRASEHLRQWVEKGSPGNDQLIDVASFHWALLLTRSGHFFEALYLVGKKVEKHGPDPTLAEAMGLAWLRNLPEDYPPQRREIVWLAGMASAYLSDLKLDRVHEFHDQLVAHYGQEPNVHYFREYVYEFEKRYDEAAEEYQQELTISPDSAVAMVQLALIDVENSQLDEARPLAIQAISLEPKNPLAHYTPGRVLLAGEEWAKSARELEVARQLAPSRGTQFVPSGTTRFRKTDTAGVYFELYELRLQETRPSSLQFRVQVFDHKSGESHGIFMLCVAAKTKAFVFRSPIC